MVAYSSAAKAHRNPPVSFVPFLSPVRIVLGFCGNLYVHPVEQALAQHVF